MKNTLLLLMALTTNIFIVNAQSPITVTVTGTCSPITGEFIYDGTLNAKNHYTREYTDGTGTFYFHVSYDNTQWVLYVDEDINEKAFYNSNVPNEMLPPNTEWIPDICSDGTMYIEGGINIGINDFIQNNNLYIYVNPDNVLKIEFSSLNQTKINVKLFNILGQSIISKSIKPNLLVYELDLNNLEAGVYVLSVSDIRKYIIIR